MDGQDDEPRPHCNVVEEQNLDEWEAHLRHIDIVGTYYDIPCPSCNTEGNHTFEGRIIQIKIWIEECLNQHPECRWPEPTPPLPTRVLDLTSLGSDSNDNIRLVDSNGLKPEHYAALTYCWGPDPDAIFKTTSENLQQNQERIEFNDLNLLFQETVTVLRHLGIPYLWIDALCIIQDDTADWEAEASKMASVYSGAHLTISAAAAKSPQKALFSNLKPEHQDYDYNDYYEDVFFEDITKGSLASRGWCLQERCLSRRIVHYGRDSVHWECCGAMSTEHTKSHACKENDAYLRRYHSRVLGPNGFLFRSALVPEPDTRVGLDPYHRWCVTIRDYTRRSLTKQSDRKPAMLGLVDLFTRGIGDKMVSGLWVGDMALGLLWCRERVCSERKHISGDLSAAPSWSWLSVSGEVYWWDPYSRDSMLERVSINAVSVDEATMTITLRGKLLPLGDMRMGDLNCDSVGHTPGNYCKVTWDYNTEPEMEPGVKWWHRLGMSTVEEALDKVRVLVIVEARSMEDGYGLMVKADRHEMYRRVGHVSLLPIDCWYERFGSRPEPPISSLPLQSTCIRLV